MGKAKSKNAKNKTIKAKRDFAQDQGALKKLKALGLFSGDLRKKHHSKYAINLVKNKFADVLRGSAKVVTVPKSQKRGEKSLAAKIAKDFAKNSDQYRAVKNKIVVRSARSDENFYFSKKHKNIISEYKNPIGETIRIEHLPQSKTGAPDKLPDLRDGQSYMLAFSRGRDGVSYTFRATAQEIYDLALQYETDFKNPYRNATGQIAIATTGAKKRERKALK
jgi:hypothetical protein